METEAITVNVNAQQPDGVEIEIVQPENETEERLLCYLLTSHVDQMKQRNQMPYDLPDQFYIDHQSEGTFVAMAHRPTEETGGFYSQPRPIAIIGIRVDGPRFDIIHAPVPEQQPATMPTPSEPSAPADSQKKDEGKK